MYTNRETVRNTDHLIKRRAEVVISGCSQNYGGYRTFFFGTRVSRAAHFQNWETFLDFGQRVFVSKINRLRKNHCVKCFLGFLRLASSSPIRLSASKKKKRLVVPEHHQPILLVA